jgi:hypothetical protein
LCICYVPFFCTNVNLLFALSYLKENSVVIQLKGSCMKIDLIPQSLSFVLGASTNLILYKLLPPPSNSQLKLLAISTSNISLGIAHSRYKKNPLGYSYALGSFTSSIFQSFKTSRAKQQELDTYSAHVNIALNRAYSEWERFVTEPSYGGDWQRIDDYIRGLEGLYRTSANRYTHDNQFSWCGAFVAFAWGPQVRLDVRKKMASCSSMYDAWANTPRYIADKIPQPGDIVTVFPNDTDRSHIPGTHLFLAATAPDENGDFQSFEGNTIGLGPNNTKIEGVAYRTRNINRIANVYRLLPEDFEDFYSV